jgi:hypothetical protein
MTATKIDIYKMDTVGVDDDEILAGRLLSWAELARGVS